jgi:hypothetical protein
MRYWPSNSVKRGNFLTSRGTASFPRRRRPSSIHPAKGPFVVYSLTAQSRTPSRLLPQCWGHQTQRDGIACVRIAFVCEMIASLSDDLCKEYFKGKEWLRHTTDSCNAVLPVCCCVLLPWTRGLAVLQQQQLQFTALNSTANVRMRDNWRIKTRKNKSCVGLTLWYFQLRY